jgi:AcrR family transcriptional regulator
VPAEEPRAADARVPGRRGLATRARLLECTVELLEGTSYRELKVIDIARKAKTSPATFYQYFADVEAAILALAEATALDTDALSELVSTGAWKGRAGYDVALALADEFIAFWERHRAVLRVVDLAVAEGDPRFRKIRSGMLNPLTVALSAVIAPAQPAGRKRGAPDPMATAGVLVAMLAHVSAHRFGFEFWGIRTADVRRSMADIIFWSVTGKRAPAG